MPQPTTPIQEPDPVAPGEVVHLSFTRVVRVEARRSEILSGLSDDDIRAECARRGIGERADVDTLTPEIVRGARGLLDWTLNRLAQASGVSVSTIKRIEEGDGESRPGKHAAIRRALEAAGVRFVSFDGAPGLVQAHRTPFRQAAE